MSFENIFNKVMEKIPYVRYAAIYRMNEKHRPGHYYSPVVNLKELALRKDAVWAAKELKGIDLAEVRWVNFKIEIGYVVQGFFQSGPQRQSIFGDDDLTIVCQIRAIPIFEDQTMKFRDGWDPRPHGLPAIEHRQT